MRLLTWNINGVRTVPQYHPWNSFKSFDEILNALEADIICFQEMKSGRKLLSQEVAVPPSFDCCISFPNHKTGYSGVATYTRSSVVVPLKAEEGLSGILQPRPPLKPDERISEPNGYPCRHARTLSKEDSDDAGDDDELDYKQLDSEGRALVIDMGLFVLINTYCPNDTGTQEREKFKMQYHRLLEARVQALITEGREVVVVGDINACAAVIDHCEGDLMIKKGQAMGLEGEEGFWGAEYRRWLRDWLQDHGGPLIDITRRFWPERKGMYTCWNTKISARESNYGTRIDYILVTPGLVPWIKASDTQPSIKGSDHCPVYVDFHESIVDSSTGKTIHLSDVLGAPRSDGKVPEPPRIATKWWEEFSGKQTSLAQFFGKKALSRTPTLVTSASSSGSSTPAPSESLTEISEPPPSASITAKRKLVETDTDTSSNPKKSKKSSVPTKAKQVGQASIASFFAKPSKEKGKPEMVDVDDADCDEDYKLALQLSQEIDHEAPPSSQTSQSSQHSKQAWSNLLTPIQPPLCKGHSEPAKEYTVNKPGPNKGKRFFICSRPVGPGYDKGRSERMREHVDPQYRCDYFKWSSDVKKEMMKSSGA